MRRPNSEPGLVWTFKDTTFDRRVDCRSSEDAFLPQRRARCSYPA